MASPCTIRSMTHPTKQNIENIDVINAFIVCTLKIAMEEINPKNDVRLLRSGIDASKLLTYDVWRLVFKYLNGKDFCAGSQVCRFWREIIAKERELHGPFYNKVHPDQLTVERSKEILDDLKIKPEMVLLWYDCSENDDDPSDLKFTKAVCICKSLPKSCNVMYINSYEVVVKPKPEKPFPPGASVGCQFFPHFPQGLMKMYYFTSYNFKSTIKKLDFQVEFNMREKSKCAILLGDNKFFDNTMQSVSSYITSNRKNKQQSLALIGGKVGDMWICKKDEGKCRKSVRGIAFLLSRPDLESWSVVVPYILDNGQSIKKKLENLRNLIQLKRHSAGLMFGCWKKVNKINVDVAAFEKVFPEVPLVYLNTLGQFGLDTFDDDPTSADRKFENGSFTVFLLVTYL